MASSMDTTSLVREPLPRSEWPSVEKFYTDADILITGATGFMGKCLVEKILYSIPGNGRVFVLIRPKKGKSVEERMEALLKLKVFDRVRSKSPELLKKVVPILGDIGKPGFGISSEDEQMLIERVSVVFHLAATIQFNSPLRESLKYNVKGVKEMIVMCRKMKQLKSFIHVSTAYSHCYKKQVDEVIYPPKVHYDKLLDAIEWMTDEQLELLVPSLREDHPNIYTFTKSLGEYVIHTEGRDLPTAIFRPSIIGAAYKEPFPGWIDCIHGAAGIFVGVGKGLVRVMKVNENGISDIVPVDYVNNMLLSVGWVTAVNRQSPDPLIYHCNIGSYNPILWIELYFHVIKSYTENPFDFIFHRPNVIKCRPPSFWPCYTFFLHYIPAYIADTFLRIMGKKPRLVDLYRKLDKAFGELNYFILNTWEWSHKNYDTLLSLMSEEDKKIFNFDMTTFEWSKYVPSFCMGTKKYLMKENIANLEIARRQIKRLRNIRYTFNFIIFLLATRLLYLRSRIARKVWMSFFAVGIQWLTKLGIPLPQYSMVNT